MMKTSSSPQNQLDNRKLAADGISGEDLKLGRKVLPLLFALGVAFYSLCVSAISAPAQGTAFTYQGRLNDAGQLPDMPGEGFGDMAVQRRQGAGWHAPGEH